MKKQILLLAALFIIFIACKKNNEPGEQDNLCPVVSKDSVPSVVQASFTNKYPSDIVVAWYNKDGQGYCAAFLKGGVSETIADFDNSGHFILEETDVNQDGNFEDSTGTKVQGCTCEFPEHD